MKNSTAIVSTSLDGVALFAERSWTRSFWRIGLAYNDFCFESLPNFGPVPNHQKKFRRILSSLFDKPVLSQTVHPFDRLKANGIDSVVIRKDTGPTTNRILTKVVLQDSYVEAWEDGD